jgi:hypothetical protein
MRTRKETHRFALTGLLVLGLLACQFVFACAPAGAFVGYAMPSFFGAGGSGSGQFVEPAGVAVNDSSGDVYVYDSGNLRVERFSASGSFEAQFNGGGPTGTFTAPARVSEDAGHGSLFDLAIDNDPSSPSVGDVYVVDPGHNVIDKFSASGAYLSQLTGFKAPVFGVAVDTTGDVWVAEEGYEENGSKHGRVQEFNDAPVNAHLTELVAEALRSPGLAVDSEQNLYLLRGEPNVIKLNNEGATLISELTFCGCGKALALEASSGKLFFDEGSSIFIYPAGATAGTPPVETITGLSGSFGVGVNASTHTMYASQGSTDAVAAFSYGLLPDVSTGVASEVQRRTAKLDGQVNPDGQAVTSCKFEYGPSEAYGHSTPCISLPGSGTTPVAVSTEITGLAAQTLYHFRLVAGNSTGEHPGEDAQLTTPLAVENVLVEGAVAVTGTTATLQGSLEPNGFPASYRFQYNSIGEPASLTALESAGSASKDEQVTANLTALTPNAIYLFSLIAENEFGQTTGGPGIFITPIIAPTVPGKPTASFITTQSAVLNAKVNPENTATRYYFQYGPCPTFAGCTNIQSTPVETSGAAGAIPSTQEITGLTPATTYTYRLIAKNELEEETAGTETQFTTTAAPVPTAQTTSASQITPTGALIAGLVNPDGLPASYTFELGIYNGASTQYGVVFSGPGGSSGQPVEETLALTGLQPGTTYAYRIAVSSGYINNETHTTQAPASQFTTPGLPAVLDAPTLLAQLPVPAMVFPNTPAQHTTPKKLTRGQRLAGALKACARDPKRRRAACRRAAKKRYGAPRRKK